jgi:hypothetical protein
MFGKPKPSERKITYRHPDGTDGEWRVPAFVPDPPAGYATVLYNGGGFGTMTVIHMLRCEQCGALVQEGYDDLHTEWHVRVLAPQPFAS